MYKNLNCDLLGISGRQSEIIELALTYGFRGIDIDMSDMVKRCQRGSFENASRFLTSSKLSVGGFEAPIDLDGDDESYMAQAALLNATAEIAHRAEAPTAFLSVPNQTDRLPYPEYFEVIRKRIGECVETFGKEDIKVALSFTAVRAADVEAKQFKFVQDVEGFVALVNSCPNTSVVFDSWNWFCGKGTPEHLDQIGIERVAAVRVADCVEGVAVEAATLSDCLLPGSTGVIDSAEYLRKLSEADRNLPVCAMGRLAEPGGTRDAFVEATQDALGKLFEQAGLPSQSRKPETYTADSYASN